MRESDKIIQAWKKAEAEMNEKAPIEIDSELMQEINGGVNSAGNICTVSGECNGTGRSCETLRGLWDQYISDMRGSMIIHE